MCVWIGKKIDFSCLYTFYIINMSINSCGIAQCVTKKKYSSF